MFVSVLGVGDCGPLIYALPLGIQFQHLHNTQLEMLNVVVALKIWSQLWENKKVKICCDNQAVVEVLKTAKTKDPFLATCARNVWLITAIFNIEIVVIHVPGKDNPIADLVSRLVTLLTLKISLANICLILYGLTHTLI